MQEIIAPVETKTKPILKLDYQLLDNWVDVAGKTIEAAIPVFDERTIIRFTDKTAIWLIGKSDGEIEISPTLGSYDVHIAVEVGLVDQATYEGYKAELRLYDQWVALVSRKRKIRRFIQFNSWAIKQALNNEPPCTPAAIEAYSLLLVGRELVEELYQEYLTKTEFKDGPLNPPT